jgi:predicted PurR-regulated permease PerM
MSGPEDEKTDKPSAGPQPEASERAAFRVRQTPEGLDVYLDENGVEIARLDEGHWSVRPRSSTSGASAGGMPSQFDLERRIDATIQDAVTFSAEQLSSMAEFLQHLVASVLETFIKIILTLMVAAFISIDLPRFLDFFRQLVPEDLHAGYDELLERVDRGLSGVVRGQLIICLVNGVLTYIGLAMLGVKFSLLLSLVAGVLSIIPVFGSVISTIPICLIALTQSLMTGVLVLGWILLIHFVEANILNPKIIGTSAEIHPVIVIFALLAGESTGGLFGAIVAVPIASIILSLFKFVRDRVWEQEEREPGIDGTVS